MRILYNAKFAATSLDVFLPLNSKPNVKNIVDAAACSKNTHLVKK